MATHVGTCLTSHRFPSNRPYPKPSTPTTKAISAGVAARLWPASSESRSLPSFHIWPLAPIASIAARDLSRIMETYADRPAAATGGALSSSAIGTSCARHASGPASSMRRSRSPRS
jgi:hypothetical protein